MVPWKKKETKSLRKTEFKNLEVKYKEMKGGKRMIYQDFDR